MANSPETGALPQFTVTAPPPVRWRERRHRGLYWLCLLLAAALVVGGAVFAYDSYRSTSGADGAVRGYLNALASADAPAALSYGAAPVGNHAFLTSDVLKQQLQLAPIRDITVGPDSSTDSGTRVPFGYTLGFGRGDLHVTDAVMVNKIGGRWQLSRVAAGLSVQLSGAQDRASFAGASLPTTEVLVFPGAVPVEFDSPYLQLSLASEAVNLSPNEGGATLGVELTAAAKTAIAAQLASMLSVCAKGGPSTEVRCPVPSPEYVPGSMSGTLVSNKTDLLMQVDSASEGLIDVSGDADFTGTYKELDFNDVPRSHTGHLSVPFTATGFAVRSLSITFTVPVS